MSSSTVNRIVLLLNAFAILSTETFSKATTQCFTWSFCSVAISIQFIQVLSTAKTTVKITALFSTVIRSFQATCDDTWISEWSMLKSPKYTTGKRKTCNLWLKILKQIWQKGNKTCLQYSKPPLHNHSKVRTTLLLRPCILACFFSFTLYFNSVVRLPKYCDQFSWDHLLVLLSFFP